MYVFLNMAAKTVLIQLYDENVFKIVFCALFLVVMELGLDFSSLILILYILIAS